LSRSLLPLSSRKLFPWCLVLLLWCFTSSARARSKQALLVKHQRRRTRHRLVLLLWGLTSKPIHELRLDLNVANTVLALTIRVIYLSLIITLKRGVVVLWFTVTCPLSSGFLPTIIPAEQFLSPKLNCAFTHTHQASTSSKNQQPTSDTLM